MAYQKITEIERSYGKEWTLNTTEDSLYSFIKHENSSTMLPRGEEYRLKISKEGNLCYLKDAVAYFESLGFENVCNVFKSTISNRYRIECKGYLVKSSIDIEKIDIKGDYIVITIKL